MLFYTQKIFTKIATLGLLGLVLLISPITYAQAPDPADTTDEDDDDQDSVQEISTILRPPKLPENLEDVGTCDGDDDTTCEPDRPDPVTKPSLPPTKLNPPAPTTPNPPNHGGPDDEDFCTLEVQTRPQVACVNAGAARYIRTNNIGHLKIVRSQITTRSASTSSVRVTRQAVQGGTADSFNGRGSLRVSLIAWTTVESVDQGQGNKFKYKTNSINQSLKAGSYLQRIFSRHSSDEHWLAAIQKRFRIHFSDQQESYKQKDKGYEDIQNQSRDITVLPPLGSRVYTLAYDPYVQANRGDALLACISDKWDGTGTESHCRSDEIKDALKTANSASQSRTSNNDWLNLKQEWGSEKIAEHNKKLLIAYFNNVYRKYAETGTEHGAWQGNNIPAGEKPKLVYSTHFAIQSCASSDGIDSRGNTRTLAWPLEQDGMSHYQAIEHLASADNFERDKSYRRTSPSPPKSPFSLIEEALDELKEAINTLEDLKNALAAAEADLAACKSANPPPPEPKPDCSAKAAAVAALKAQVAAQEAKVENLLDSKLTKGLKNFMNEQVSCYEVRTGIVDEASSASDVIAYQPGWWEHTDLGFACKLLEEVAKITATLNKDSRPEKFTEIKKELKKVLRLEKARFHMTAKNKSCSPNTDSLDVAKTQPFNASGGSGSRPPRWHNILSSAVLDMRQTFKGANQSTARFTQSIFVSSHPSAGFSVADKKKFLMTQDPSYITFYSSEHYPDAEEYIPGLPMILIPGKKYVAPNIVSPNQNQCVGVHSSPLAMCELVNITLFRGRHGR